MPEVHFSYVREKLRNAAATIRDNDRPLQERLHSAYLDNLSSLEPHFFPHKDAQDEFRAIVHAFNRYGEMGEGVGSMPTTLFTMSDAEARTLGDRVLVIADRYLA